MTTTTTVAAWLLAAIVAVAVAAVAFDRYGPVTLAEVFMWYIQSHAAEARP